MVREQIAVVGAQIACIETGSLWENGYCESFDASFRSEPLNSEIFYSLPGAKVAIANWRHH